MPTFHCARLELRSPRAGHERPSTTVRVCRARGELLRPASGRLRIPLAHCRPRVLGLARATALTCERSLGALLTWRQEEEEAHDELASRLPVLLNHRGR